MAAGLELVGLSASSSAVLGLFVGACFVGFLLVVRKFSARPLPGTLKPQGTYEYEDPANDSAISERKRDFMRIVGTNRDLWILTPSERQPGTVLPAEAFKKAEQSEEGVYNSMKTWLQGELKKLPTPAESAELEEVLNRVVYFVSTSPGFEFAMRHRVQPCLLQPKYVVMISKSGEVRAAWYAFCSDKVVPGATAGPFVLKLVTEDLRKSRNGRTHTEHNYTAKATSEKDMDKLIGKQLQLILKGIDTDNWQPYLAA
mmetsp:Transcript_88663/g.185295  ORF Transcript_88663/g.185295 Transcript_88663/m.185295 type:complete len:257 (+) Transcript_88663:42-812(+)